MAFALDVWMYGFVRLCGITRRVGTKTRSSQSSLPFGTIHEVVAARNRHKKCSKERRGRKALDGGVQVRAMAMIEILASRSVRKKKESHHFTGDAQYS